MADVENPERPKELANKPYTDTVESRQALADACSPLHRKFAELYVASGELTVANRGKAAVDAGCSPKSCKFQGALMAKRPEVKAYIQFLLREQAERAEITPDWVITKLRREIEDRGPKSSQAARIQGIRLMADILRMTKAEENNSSVSVPVKVFVGVDASQV